MFKEVRLLIGTVSWMRLSRIWLRFINVHGKMTAVLIDRVLHPFLAACQNLILHLARRATERRLASGRIRTLWGYTPILTLPLLARCDRLLGFKSQSLVFVTYYITSGFDINLTQADRAASWLTRKAWSPSHVVFRKAILALVLLRYDVVHSFYDRAILFAPDRFGIDQRELNAMSITGKRLYTYAYGGDVRAREPTLALGTPNICAECPEPGKFCICNSAELESSMQRLQGKSTCRVAMGDMTAYVPDCRNMHYWPLDTDRFKVEPLQPRQGRPLRVAHAPNHGHFKGTRFLLAAIEQLQADGYAIELVSVQGVPNEKVIELFAGSDLVADQFIAGFHGYTALEAMALGRPVLCFLRGSDMTIDPETCPIINTRPETIYDVLRQCVVGDIDLEAIGKRSRRYVERYYSLEAVAARLGRMYMETAGFPVGVNARLNARVTELEAKLLALPSAWAKTVREVV